MEEVKVREELSEYLDGLQEQMPLAFWKLAEIFKYQVFELCEEPEEKEEESGKSYFIPYMMNDAIEDYLVLENCRMVGEVAAEEQAGGLELSARISGKEGAYVLVVRQKSLLHGEETVFTLHFEKIRESRTCYQYHEIGHFWMEGQEQWRRLVYMAGTIYDKFAYVGEEVCTEGELELHFGIGPRYESRWKKNILRLMKELHVWSSLRQWHRIEDIWHCFVCTADFHQDFWNGG